MSMRSYDGETSRVLRGVGRVGLGGEADSDDWVTELVQAPLHLVAAEYTVSSGWQTCSVADLIYYSNQRVSRPRIVMRPGCPGVFAAIQLWDVEGCWGALFLDRDVRLEEIRAWALLLNAVFDLDSSVAFVPDEQCSTC